MTDFVRLGHRPPLDGVRGIAALIVVAYHLGLAWPSDHRFFGLMERTRDGFLGVDVFFALSGFLITSILLEELDWRGRVRFRTFYARRALRLLPAVGGVLVVLTVYVTFARHRPEFDPFAEDALATLFYVQNWHAIWDTSTRQGLLIHAWSLSIEEQFYLLWPALLVGLMTLLNRRRAALVVTIAACAASAWSAYLVNAQSYDRAFYGLDSRSGGLLIGCAAALLTADGWFKSGRTWNVVYRSACAAVALGFVVLFARGVNDLRLGPRWLFFATAVATTVVIIAVVHDADGPPARVLSWRPLVAVGRVSYGLYLWHYPVILVISVDRVTSPSLRLAFRIVAIAAVTVGSYMLVERPFLRLKDRVAARRRFDVVNPRTESPDRAR